MIISYELFHEFKWYFSITILYEMLKLDSGHLRFICIFHCFRNSFLKTLKLHVFIYFCVCMHPHMYEGAHMSWCGGQRATFGTFKMWVSELKFRKQQVLLHAEPSHQSKSSLYTKILINFQSHLLEMLCSHQLVCLLILWYFNVQTLAFIWNKIQLFFSLSWF